MSSALTFINLKTAQFQIGRDTRKQFRTCSLQVLLKFPNFLTFKSLGFFFFEGLVRVIKQR